MNISNICNTISNAIESIKLPATPIPPIILAMGGELRHGINPSMVAANIIQRQSEAGAPYGPSADGSANISEAMEVIRVEEIMKALKYDSQIQVAIPPGSIKITATGANAGGPIVVQGTNTTVVNGYGIIQ